MSKTATLTRANLTPLTPDKYAELLKLAEAMAERYVSQLFGDAALSLNRLDEIVGERYDVEMEMYTLLRGEEDPNETEDERCGARMAACGDAGYLMGVAIGRRLGMKGVK